MAGTARVDADGGYRFSLLDRAMQVDEPPPGHMLEVLLWLGGDGRGAGHMAVATGSMEVISRPSMNMKLTRRSLSQSRLIMPRPATAVMRMESVHTPRHGEMAAGRDASM